MILNALMYRTSVTETALHVAWCKWSINIYKHTKLLIANKYDNTKKTIHAHRKTLMAMTKPRLISILLRTRLISILLMIRLVSILLRKSTLIPFMI